MREWRYSSTIPDFGTGWKWVVSFTSLPLYSQRNSPRTHWIEGWMGSRAGLDVLKERKTLPPAGNRTPAVQPVARRYTAWAIPALKVRRRDIFKEVTASFSKRTLLHGISSWRAELLSTLFIFLFYRLSHLSAYNNYVIIRYRADYGKILEERSVVRWLNVM
jgi:hypothetical protein